MTRSKDSILGLNDRGFYNALLDHSKSGTLENLRNELRAEGHNFTRGDFMHRAHGKFPNIICNSAEFKFMPLHLAKDIMQYLHEAGTPLTADDWKYGYTSGNYSSTIIGTAGELAVLKDVFNPKYWAGRTDEMQKVWEAVPDEYRNQVDFDKAFKKAKKLALPPTLRRSKDDILEPNGRGFYSALLKAARNDKMDELRDTLRQHGHDLTREDLMHPANGQFPNIICDSGIREKVPLKYAAKIMEWMHEAGTPLTAKDWKTTFTEYCRQYTILDTAGELGVLKDVFNPKYWAGRTDEMMEIWEAVPNHYKSQVDINTILHTIEIDDKPVRTKPIILTSAHTGARYSPWQVNDDGTKVEIGENFYAEHMPISPKEAIADAKAAYDAGARLIHFHARNPLTGAQHADPEWYQEVIAGIREQCPGAIVSFPTSRKGEVGKGIDEILSELPRTKNKKQDIQRRADIEASIRASALEALPDTCTTFTVPEMRIFGTPKDNRGVEVVPGWSDPQVMQNYFKQVNKRANELGVMQEIEITTMGEFEVLEKLAQQKEQYHFEGPLHVVLILGFSNGLPIKKQTFDEALDRIDQLKETTGFDIIVSCGAVIRPNEAATSRNDYKIIPSGHHDYNEVMNWVLHDDRVSAFRVGLEDTPVLYQQQQTNEGLVNHAREYFEQRDITVQTQPAKVRKTFNLPTNPTIIMNPSSERDISFGKVIASLHNTLGLCKANLTLMSIDHENRVANVEFTLGEGKRHTLKIKPHSKDPDILLCKLDKHKKSPVESPEELRNMLYANLVPNLDHVTRYQYHQAIRQQAPTMEMH